MSKTIEDLDAEISALRERVTEIATVNILLADRTEQTRRNLQERMDVLESFVGQIIDRVQDHATNPDAHDEAVD